MDTSKAQAALRRKLQAAERLAKQAFARNGEALPRAWFLTDPKRTPDPAAIAARLPRGWGVIYRHHGAPGRLAVAQRLARIARQRGLILLISADPALAARVRAHGVHWPEKRLTGIRPRNPRSIETAAAHSRAAITRAQRLGIDAVFLSTVFDSRSPSAGAAMGPLRFRQIARCAGLPVYALGGVTADNAARATTHAAGFAAIDAIVSAFGS